MLIYVSGGLVTHVCRSAPLITCCIIKFIGLYRRCIKGPKTLMSIIEKDDKATNDSINADAGTTMQEAYSSINFTRYSIRIGLSTLLWAHAKRVFMKYY